MKYLNYFSVLVLVAASSLFEVSCGVQLDPRGRNVCKFPKRNPYANNGLAPQQWQVMPVDLNEYRCCAGWRQYGDSCSEAVCENPCVYGFCAAPNYCKCDDNWTGPRCSEPCQRLSHGSRCLMKCATCPSGLCDHPDGTCTCPDGFTGPNCNEPCESGFYGTNCLLECQCDTNVTCAADTGSCMKPQNMTFLPDEPHIQLHVFRMTVLTGCGVASVMTLIGTAVYAVRKRQTRRVFNVRKRTMSMKPISRRPATHRRVIQDNDMQPFEGSHTKFQKCPPKYPRGCISSSYIGMSDILEADEETTHENISRPLSCLSTSTTISMVESITELRDTIYEVQAPRAMRTRDSFSPVYTNFSGFLSTSTSRRLHPIQGSVIRDCNEADSDTDSEEYNYPYADLSSLRLPGTPVEMTDTTGRPLVPSSSNTEYVVVLKHDQQSACFTPQQMELQGMRRERPSGMSFARAANPPAASPQTSEMKSIQDGVPSGEAQPPHYLAPRTPPVKRHAGASGSQSRAVRGYVTSVKRSSSIKRGSDHRRTRRERSQILKCPPPPPYSHPADVAEPPKPHVYVNDRIHSGPMKKTMSCIRTAPPIPKPRTMTKKPAPKVPPPVTTPETDEPGPEAQGTERFI